MTLGQRIQELRKQRSLSQEALGELLGVSRQAISKWESDVTMPEVDTLVALSRLFRVPVGELLGVEQPEEPAAPVTQELTDREIAAMEAIVAHYLQQREAQKPPKKIWPVVLSVAVVLFSAVQILGWTGQVDRRFNSLQGQVERVQSDINQQNSSLAGRVEEILKQQNALIADWSYTIDRITPEESLLLTLNVTPREYRAGTTAQLWAGTAWTQGTWDGRCFSGQLTLPLCDELPLSVLFLDGEVQQTQPLDTLYGLESATRLNLAVGFDGGTSFPLLDGTEDQHQVKYEGQIRVRIDAEAAIQYGLALAPVSGEVRVLVRGVQVMVVPLDLSGWAATGNCEVLLDWNRSIPMGVWQKGDEIKRVVAVTDNFGRTSESVLDWWRIRARDSRLEPDIVDCETGKFIFD